MILPALCQAYGRRCARPGWDPEGGFSLIEAVCALLVLGIGVVGVAEGITAALQATKEAEVRSTAAFLAAGRIELLRADGFITSGEDHGAFSDPFSHYKWRESIRETDLQGLYEVVVSVELESRSGSVFELRTLLFDAPLDSATSTSEPPLRSQARERSR